jgi:hypothetical protein
MDMSSRARPASFDSLVIGDVAVFVEMRPNARRMWPDLVAARGQPGRGPGEISTESPEAREKAVHKLAVRRVLIGIASGIII